MIPSVSSGKCGAYVRSCDSFKSNWRYCCSVVGVTTEAVLVGCHTDNTTTAPVI